MTGSNRQRPAGRAPASGRSLLASLALAAACLAAGPAAGGEAPPAPGTPPPAAVNAPASASEARARADREFQAGQWLEAYADYAAACRFFAQQEEQAGFERNATQAGRARLHALACLAEMDWIYRHYPTPLTALPVTAELYKQLSRQPILQARSGRLLLAIAADAGEVSLEKRLRSEQRYLVDWQILGPTYPETELEPATTAEIAEEAVNTAFSPLRLKSRSLELGTPVAVRGSQVAWRRLPDIPVDGRIPLHHLVPPAPGRRLLAATWLKVPARQDLALSFTVNGPMRVYHDFAPVASQAEGFDGELTAVRLTLRLHAGWNRLLVELEAPANRAEAAGEIAPGRLLATRPEVGWWLGCQCVEPAPDLVVDAVRDHPIDEQATANEEDFGREVRTLLTPTLPGFPSMPEDMRTWSDVHRDLLIAWMQAAGDAAGGSRVARAAVAAQVAAYAEVMKDDLRYPALLARLTPAGVEGFRFATPQEAWLETLEKQFAGQSTVGAWLAAEARRWPYLDYEGAAQAVAAPAGGGSGSYEVRAGLQAALLALSRQTQEARNALEAIARRAEGHPEQVPATIWSLLARQQLNAGQYAACAATLEKIPPQQPQFEALATAAALYDRWNFGRDRSVALARAEAYLAAAPLDPRGWRLQADLQTAAGQWAAASASRQRALALQPDVATDWTELAKSAAGANDSDLAERSRAEAARRAGPPQPAWRLPPPSLSLENLRTIIHSVETASNAEPEKDKPPTTPAAAAGGHPTRAFLRDYDYLDLLDERTDTVSDDGEVESDHSEWIYLRTRRAAKQFQRLEWPAAGDGIPATVQVRRFRPGELPAAGAPERELEGVTIVDPAGGVTITRLEDLAAGDVLQIRYLKRIPATRVEAAEYAAHVTFGGELPCLHRRFTLVYPSRREVLWRRTGAGLDFSSQLDPTYRTTQLTWERELTVVEPKASAELRLNFQSNSLSALEWLRRRTPSDIAVGEDMAVYVERLRAGLRARPKLSEALARALYEFVRTQVTESERGRPFIELPLAPSPTIFSRRRGNRWERCQLLATLLRSAGLDAYVYAIRTNTKDLPDPRQQVPVLPEDFDDCAVGWHRPFDSILWLYPHGDERLEFGQVPVALGDHPALRLNPRGPVILERLPHANPVTLFPGEETP